MKHVYASTSSVTSPATSPKDAFEFDVFISYRQHEPELSWVRQVLVPRLEAAGVKAMIDVRDFRLGRPLIKEMERGVLQSRYTLVIATPAYFKSLFTEFENLLSQQLGLEQAKDRLLVVMRESCELTLRLSYKLWLSMIDDEQVEENLPRLAQALLAPLDGC
jgi:hypothetical protein